MTKVTKDDVPALLFRGIQGALTIQCAFYALTMFDVSTVGNNNSASSVFVIIFAYLILGEKLPLF